MAETHVLLCAIAPHLKTALEQHRRNSGQSLSQGTLVGFWVPPYMQMVNVPGFHFHFLSQDRSCGGHLLECLTGEMTIALDETPYTQIALPHTDAFRDVNLTKDTRHELEAAEQDR